MANIININVSAIFDKRKLASKALRQLADQLESDMPIGPVLTVSNIPGVELKGSCDLYYNSQV